MNQNQYNLNQSNFNTQSNNCMQNNQPLITNQNNNIQQSSGTKKKLKWWIPFLLFLSGFLMTIGSLVVEMIIRSQEELVLDHQITNYPVIMIFRWLAVICWFLVVPSLIFVIVKYNKKTTKEKNQENIQINNMISNATSLDEKLLIAYIGNNYQQIMLKKLSIPALFLNWMYIGYRKFYKLLLIYVIPMVILSIILNENILMLIYIPFAILAGIKFNKWYLNDVKKQINKIKMSNSQASESELISICSNKGGTSIIPVILTIVGMSVLGTIIRVVLTIILSTFLGAM